jgi:peptidoglycan/xylan/chitin deacetylase (PgdA/CDA1 family)
VDWPEVDALAANPRIDIFSHTMTHPWKTGETLVDWVGGRTAGRTSSDAARELAESRRVLEARLHRPVPYLAWPSGFYNDTLIALARDAGYSALLTIDDGVNTRGADLSRLHRTMVHGACDLGAFRQILQDGVFRTCGAAEPSSAADTNR